MSNIGTLEVVLVAEPGTLDFEIYWQIIGFYRMLQSSSSRNGDTRWYY